MDIQGLLNIFFFWRNSPARARASSILRFVDHIQWHNTVGRTPLDEWSARSRDLYLTTHNTHNRHTSMPIKLSAADNRFRRTGHLDSCIKFIPFADSTNKAFMMSVPKMNAQCSSENMLCNRLQSVTFQKSRNLYPYSFKESDSFRWSSCGILQSFGSWMQHIFQNVLTILLYCEV
jgi:hypothetical protein